MKKPYGKWLLVLFAIASLAGCLLPDNYSATLTISENRVTLVYDGDVVLLPLYGDIKSGKGTPEKQEEFMNEFMNSIADDIEKHGGKLSHSYEGEARSKINYSIDIDVPSSPNYKEEDSLHLFTVRRTVDGHIRLSSIEIRDAITKKIQKAGLASSGDICVKTEGKVIEHNADKEPGLLSSCYEWRLDSLSGKVASIVVEF